MGRKCKIKVKRFDKVVNEWKRNLRYLHKEITIFTERVWQYNQNRLFINHQKQFYKNCQEDGPRMLAKCLIKISPECFRRLYDVNLRSLTKYKYSPCMQMALLSWNAFVFIRLNTKPLVKNQTAKCKVNSYPLSFPLLF